MLGAGCVVGVLRFAPRFLLPGFMLCEGSRMLDGLVKRASVRGLRVRGAPVGSVMFCLISGFGSVGACYVDE